MKHNLIKISSKKEMGQNINKSILIRYNKAQVEAIFKKGFGAGTSFSVDNDGTITIEFAIDTRVAEYLGGISISSKA